MLNIINRYCHGFLVTPVICACQEKGFFSLLSQHKSMDLPEIAERLNANTGHLQVTLRMMQSLGWLALDESGSFSLTPKARLHEQIPPDIVALYRSPIHSVLRDEQLSSQWQHWLNCSLKRWHIDDAIFADFLDGVLVTPLLQAIENNVQNISTADLQRALLTELAQPVREAAFNWLITKGWMHRQAGQLRWTDMGQFMVDRAMLTGTTASYTPMLSRISEVLFGNCRDVFSRDSEGHENHVDRTLNVIASGFQHKKYFADVEESILSIFNQLPFEEQPNYIVDMGCGDGTFLKRVYDTIQDRSARGQVSKQYPLCMIGVDYNQASLDATTLTLADLPHLVVQGDIGDPQQMITDLQSLGIADPENILHIRSFLDHDRPFIPPQREDQLNRRSHLPYSGVYVDAAGHLIPPHVMVQSLVEHLGRWASVVNQHGLILLEVHCLEPEIVHRFLDLSENLHFDAFQAFSMQHLIEADVFIMSAAEVGLFPKFEFSKRYPKTFPFTRITLNCFDKRPYTIRHPHLSDLPALLNLERQCLPDHLRASAEELQQRLIRFSNGHCLLEMNDQIVGVMYSQKIDNPEHVEQIRYENISSLHTPEGSVVQLLGINILPEIQGQGFADQLREFMLQWCALRSNTDRVVGVTRCKNYINYPQMSIENYIWQRNSQGQLLDPILRFHEEGGATIQKILPDYRPEDIDNHGVGILIEYDLRNLGRKTEPLSKKDDFGLRQPTPQAKRSVEDSVGDCIRIILGQKRQDAFNPSRSLMDMGLDSLELLELRALLSQSLGIDLEPTFFFRCGTPAAIAQFFQSTEQPSQKYIFQQVPAAAVEQEQTTGATDADGFTSLKEIEDAISIVGMACRFPGGADSPDKYWSLLYQGIDAVSVVPPDRSSLLPNSSPHWGGFLEQVDQFDAAFFRISPREAVQTDPQQRILLEETWKALESAGINPESLAGSQTGVFVGIFSHDYELLQVKHSQTIDSYFATGNSTSVAAGRLAYALDLRGPAIAVNTACSSSLVAVHLACQSLRNQECDLALAAGVNLLLSPELNQTFSQTGMLSADGRCKTFDASADGYVRSEGCGVVVLKRLSQALTDQDPILAIIRGTAINQDGASNGLTAPNQLAQEAVIRQALSAANVQPHQVEYVEAHGTGTSLGDPVEVRAIETVYGQERTLKNPLVLGSVKTNIGHTEAAAGIAGMIKVVLSLQQEWLPQHLHFNSLNPHMSLDRIPAIIPTTGQTWQRNSVRRRLAGVSSFGFSGTNAHVILEEAPVRSQPPLPIDRFHHLLTLSARTPTALQELARSYAAYLQHQPDVSLADFCFTANSGRSSFEQRLALVADSIEQLHEQLTAFAAYPETVGLLSGQVRSHRPKIAFLFTGQGSQYGGMGHQLYETQPVFREAIDRCNALLQPDLELSLLEVLYPAINTSTLLNQTVYTQPALFAVEYALAQLWQSWGIRPDVVMGHSVGEYVAACIAGVFSLEDGLKFIADRGRLMQGLPQDGAMLAVMADENWVTPLLQPYAQEVSIAAINGSQNVVISGRKAATDAIAQLLGSMGVKVTPLAVSHAFHSPLMEPILADFAQVADQVRYTVPQIPLISNVSGKLATEELTTPEYWCRHVRQPVQFAAGIKTLQQQGYDLFVEIGARPILSGMGKACLPADYGIWCPSLRPGYADLQVLFESLGQLYVQGATIDWHGVEQGYSRRRLSLPTYPFQRQSYWIDIDRVQSDSPQPQTAVIDLLNRADIEQLSQLVQQANSFSVEQIQLLPELLEALVKQHQQQRSPDSIDSIQDLLYEVEWQAQGLFSPHLYPDYLPNPKTVGDRLQSVLTEVISQPELTVQLEALSLTYILQAFTKLEWTLQVGQRFATASLIQQLGIATQHQRLFDRLLEIMAEENILRSLDSGWEIIQLPQSSTLDFESLMAQYPTAKTELILFHRCASKLADVLQGTCDALSLLFPDADASIATHLYQDSLTFGQMNGLVQQVVAQLREQQPSHQGIRILEIGAGTGGTTTHLLPHFDPHRTEYTFTDVGAFFLNQAQEKFQSYPFLRYQVLDIEQDPQTQGFAAHQYDVILAANVLHATADLRKTLQHIQQLLAPGGMLILLEGTAHRRWIDLTFGLAEGWWRFTDQDLRSSYPLLSAAQWQTILPQVGFENTTAIASHSEDLFPQSIILAQTPQSVERSVISSASSTAQHWLIFADRQGIAQALATQLRSQGATCTLIFADQTFDHQISAGIGNSERTIHPEKPIHFQQLLTEFIHAKSARSTPTTLKGVVHLWSLDTPLAEQITGEYLEAAAKLTCGSVLLFIQALMNIGVSHSPRLWLVTQGAATLPQQPVPGLAQSALWGMGKVIGLEHPELNSICVDLGMETTQQNAQVLFEEIWADSAVTQVAIRKGDRPDSSGRWIAKLTRHKPTTQTQPPIRFLPAATYLLTGGLGGLGLQVAEWMVERGARHLVLAGRISANSTAQAKIKQLEHRGAQVLVAQVDVAEPAQVECLIANIQQLPPLRGVIHAAGVLDDGILQQQTWERFARVLAPKVKGAWNLHQFTQQCDLDFFVVFSSAASLLGATGQANHAAANAFLDALMCDRQARGLPALSINWGPWREVGAAASPQIAELWQRRGIQPLSSSQGLRVLEYLMSQSVTQTGALAIDWSVFGKATAPSSYLANFQLPTDIAIEKTLDFGQQLERVSSEQRYEMLINYVQDQVAKVLGQKSIELIDPQQGFFDLGMDSLTSVELRNRLQIGLKCSLPSTFAFDYPTVTAVTNYLMQQVCQTEAIHAIPVSDSKLLAENEPEEVLAAVMQLSDNEIETSIVQELAELEALLKQKE